MISGEIIQLNHPIRFSRLHPLRDIPLNNIDVPILILSASPTPDYQDKPKRHHLQHDMVAEYNRNSKKKPSSWHQTYPNSRHLTTRPTPTGDTGTTKN